MSRVLIGYVPTTAVSTSAALRVSVGCAAVKILRTGAVSSASGSAYAEFGSTKVIVSVFGPRGSKKAMMYSDTGRLNCNVSYTTFAMPIRGQLQEIIDLSSTLHKALEGAIIFKSFPKTTVDVFAFVLESGGSDLPVVISCASLALADTRIMLYDMVTSVSVDFLIDPISEEESYQDGSLMITFMPSHNEVTQMTVTGEWSIPKIHEAMQLCLDACSELGKITRSCLKEAASGTLNLSINLACIFGFFWFENQPRMEGFR